MADVGLGIYSNTQNSKTTFMSLLRTITAE